MTGNGRAAKMMMVRNFGPYDVTVEDADGVVKSVTFHRVDDGNGRPFIPRDDG